MRMRYFSSALVLFVMLSPAFGQRNDNIKYKPIFAVLVDVIAKSTDSTVRVRCEDKDAALGTVVGTDGWILTKYSQLKGDPICKLKDGREFPAKLVGVQQQFDVALLKIDAKNLPVAEWRESKEDGVGSWVASPGLGKEPLAVGIISVASRNIDPRNSRRYSPDPNSGYLGVTMGQGNGGVVIENVNNDTPAAKSGMKAGDLIKSIDGKPISDIDAMAEILGKHRRGDKVTIKFTRDGKPMEIITELAARPFDLNRGIQQNRMGSALSDRRSGFPTILQHDTILKPADCGGPLVDLDGRVVGVNIARAGRTESYAIPAETIQTLVVDLEAGKYPPPRPSMADVFGPQVFEAETKLHDLQSEKAAVEKRIKDAEETRRKQEQKIKEDGELLRKQEQKIKDAEETLRKLQEKLDQAQKADNEKKAADKKAPDKKPQ